MSNAKKIAKIKKRIAYFEREIFGDRLDIAKMLKNHLEKEFEMSFEEREKQLMIRYHFYLIETIGKEIFPEVYNYGYKPQPHYELKYNAELSEKTGQLHDLCKFLSHKVFEAFTKEGGVREECLFFDRESDHIYKAIPNLQEGIRLLNDNYNSLTELKLIDLEKANEAELDIILKQLKTNLGKAHYAYEFIRNASNQIYSNGGVSNELQALKQLEAILNENEDQIQSYLSNLGRLKARFMIKKIMFMTRNGSNNIVNGIERAVFFPIKPTLFEENSKLGGLIHKAHLNWSDLYSFLQVMPIDPLDGAHNVTKLHTNIITIHGDTKLNLSNAIQGYQKENLYKSSQVRILHNLYPNTKFISQNNTERRSLGFNQDNIAVFSKESDLILSNFGKLENTVLMGIETHKGDVYTIIQENTHKHLSTIPLFVMKNREGFKVELSKFIKFDRKKQYEFTLTENKDFIEFSNAYKLNAYQHTEFDEPTIYFSSSLDKNGNRKALNPQLIILSMRKMGSKVSKPIASFMYLGAYDHEISLTK